MYCEECGSEMAVEAKFCGKCGTAINGASANDKQNDAAKVAEGLKKIASTTASVSKGIAALAGEKAKKYAPVVKQKATEMSKDLAEQAKQINQARREAVDQTVNTGDQNKLQHYSSMALSFANKLSTKQKIIIGCVLVLGFVAIRSLFGGSLFGGQSGFERELVQLSKKSNPLDNSRSGEEAGKKLDTFIADNIHRKVSGWKCEIRTSIYCIGDGDHVEYDLSITTDIPDKRYDKDTIVFSGEITSIKGRYIGSSKVEVSGVIIEKIKSK